MLGNSAKNDDRGLLFRITVHAGRDRRKGDRANVVRERKAERVSVSVGQQFRVTAGVLSIDRADRVDNVICRQFAGRRYDRLPCWQAVGILLVANAFASVVDGSAAFAMDRSVNAAAPSSDELAALTIASERSSVISPTLTTSRPSKNSVCIRKYYYLSEASVRFPTGINL